MPAKPVKRALFGNAAFQMVAGSELVILEAAEYLISQGWEVDLTAWYFGEPMLSHALTSGLRIIERPDQARPFEYDLVWLQNRLEAVLDYSPSEKEVRSSFFVFAHLDKTWSYAQPGVVAEPLLGQMFIVPSELGVERVVKRGLPAKNVSIYRNPAPAGFEDEAPVPAERLRRLLIVSNHAPPELVIAQSLLQAAAIEVIHLGVAGDRRHQRVTPEDIISADAVVSIGKTIPYALRARRPVYVYDHFGGPGWLLDDNFATVKSRNFSGLCCERRLEAVEIAEELVNGYTKAARQAARREVDPAFCLEKVFAQIFERMKRARTVNQHRKRMASKAVALLAERELAQTAGEFFNWAHHLNSRQ